MVSKGAEVLDKIKELRNTANEVVIKLERDGLSITNIPKAQLFDYNIKNIIGSVESMLRNEPPEKAVLRLEKEIPDLYNNIKKIKETAPGRLNAEHLDKIKQLVEYIEQNYKRL